MTTPIFDIMIVAAGNGTRMGENSLPKILTKINGKSNLHNTFDKLTEAKNIGHIYIVVNKRNHAKINESINEYISYYAHPLMDSVSIIEIESGRGDGHAVLKAAEKIEKLSPWFFVLWGDAYLTSGEIFNDCVLEKSQNHFNQPIPMYIPVINEKDPYVTFLVDKDMNCLSADFSKRGEHHPTGFHDQCLFFCDKQKILSSLNVLEQAFFKNGRYVTDSGELTFLYLVHYLYNSNACGAKAIITDSPVLSYNTLGEVKEIEKILQN